MIEVDSEHAVPWMSTTDADEKVVMGIGPRSKLDHPGGVSAAFVDGHVQFLDADMPAADVVALFPSRGATRRISTALSDPIETAGAAELPANDTAHLEGP